MEETSFMRPNIQSVAEDLDSGYYSTKSAYAAEDDSEDATTTDSDPSPNMDSYPRYQDKGRYRNRSDIGTPDLSRS